MGPATAPTLRNVREVAVERHEPPGSTTRWCMADCAWAGSERTTPVGWDMFATTTLLGVTYGLRPCFADRDPHDPHCLPTPGRDPDAVVRAWEAARSP